LLGISEKRIKRKHVMDVSFPLTFGVKRNNPLMILILPWYSAGKILLPLAGVRKGLLQ